MSKIIIAGLGKRAEVKIPSPQASLQQILEDFCSKQGLDPVLHALKHGNSTIDLSVPWRLSGIPSNAHLEVIKRDALSIAKALGTGGGVVSLALQLPTGERLQTGFPPNTSLLDILFYWEKERQGLNLTQNIDAATNQYQTPVFNYMSREVVTLEDLRTTTLSKLGIPASSSALVRLIFRPSDRNAQEAIAFVNQARDSSSTPSTPSTSAPAPIISAPVVVPPTPIAAAPAPPTVEAPASTFQIVDGRRFRILRPSEVDIDPRKYDVDPSFFDPTVEDVKLAQKAMSSGNDGMLMTRAMREAAAESKKRIYTETMIRVRFPDAYMLEASFKPSEKLSALRSFVKQHVHDASLPFYLYVAPPVRRFTDANENDTLEKLELCPAAVVNLSSDQKENVVRLRDEVRSDAKDIAVVPSYVPEAINQPKAEIQGAASASASSAAGKQPMKQYEREEGDGSKPKATPKWLKMGK